MPERYNTDFWSHLQKLVESSQIVIDRPKGSAHPKYPDMVYPVDYGYLAGTTSSDGGGIDVWMGSLKPSSNEVCAVLCTVDLIKRDSELKILLNCNEDEMITIAQFVNDNSLGCLLLRRQ